MTIGINWHGPRLFHSFLFALMGECSQFDPVAHGLWSDLVVLLHGREKGAVGQSCDSLVWCEASHFGHCLVLGHQMVLS